MLRSLGDGLFGEVFGSERPAVLALPGWMRTRSDFASAMHGFDALALDLPGFGGASPTPTHPGGAAHYADIVEPALAQCSDKIIVVGHSFGGRVAVHLAERHPDRIAALVLVGVPLLPRCDRPILSVSVAHRAARWANRRSLLSDKRMEQRRQRHGSQDYRDARGVMRDVLVTVVNETYEAQLRAIADQHLHVELLWGADDDAVPVSTAQRAAMLIGANAHLSVVDRVGHLLPLQDPASLQRTIATLLT